MQYKYVETAKRYLTVYKTTSGDYYYHPSEEALREDMAVALVKALGFVSEEADESLLDQFEDEDEISPKLISYVAIAVKHQLMRGYTNSSGDLVFDPQGTLTRAQTAVLLHNAFKANEEKIAYEEEEKVVYDEEQDTITISEDGERVLPVISGYVSDNGINLSWNKIIDSDFNGYKVVISKGVSSPAYPNDGYYRYITDRSNTSVTVEAGDSYNGGDFGGKLKSGETYYFSITALYDNEKVAGNTIRLQMP